MSFARGLAAGQAAAQNALDAYKNARINREVRGLMRDPQEMQGLTAQDGQQLEAMASAMDPQGNPYYQVQDNGRGGLQVRNNFSYAGQDGQEVAPGSTTAIQPRTLKEWNGQRFEAGELTPERLSALRRRGIADIYTRFDPEKGLGMMRDIERDERDAVRFGREQKRWGREDVQAEREDEAYALDQKIRAEISQYASTQVGPDGQQKPLDPAALATIRARVLFANGRHEEAAQASAQFLQTSLQQIQLQSAERSQALGPAISGLLSGDFGPAAEFYNRFIPDGATVTDIKADKNGQVTISRVSADGRTLPDQRVSVEELQQTMVALADPMEALALAQRSFANNIALENLGISRRKLGLQERQVRNAETRANAEDWSVIGTSADGKGLTRFNRRTGAVESVPMPEGMSAADVFQRISGRRADYTARDVADLTRQILENATPDPDAPGEIIRDPLKARAIAISQLEGQPYRSASDRILEAFWANRQPEPPAPATPAGVRPPSRQINTITPPRTGADMRPKPAMTDEDIIRLLAK